MHREGPADARSFRVNLGALHLTLPSNLSQPTSLEYLVTAACYACIVVHSVLLHLLTNKEQ
jgi:hypothetical protein